VRRVETVDPATEVAWLKVVIRHEAMAIRRARSESVNGEEMELDAFIPGPERSVEDQITSGERVRRSAEALRALKPDEAKALMMKAHGLSYDEIGERNGWSYTKVNRAITEGRRRFMSVYEEIETGEQCERFGPIVEALAGGAATPAQVLEIRPHLRHCSVCRAAVRDLHLSRARRATLFWPIFALTAPRGRSSPSVEERLQELAGQTPVPLERIADDVGHMPLELSLEAPAEPVGGGRLESMRQTISEFFHRASASDVATGIQIAASSGGGRVTTVAAVLGLCLSGAGIGTVCAVSGLVPHSAYRFGWTDAVQQAPRHDGAAAKRDHTPSPRNRDAAHSSTPSSTTSSIRLGGQTSPPEAAASPAGREAQRRTKRQDAARAVKREFGFEDPNPGNETATPVAAHAASSSARASPRVEPAAQEFNPAEQEFTP
jgi:Sigma-70, region 4